MCICTNSNSLCAYICSTSPSKRTMCQRARVNLNSIHASHAYTEFCSTARGEKHGLNGLAPIQPRSSCQILSSKPSRFNLSRGALKPPGEKKWRHPWCNTGKSKWNKLLGSRPSRQCKLFFVATRTCGKIELV